VLIFCSQLYIPNSPRNKSVTLGGVSKPESPAGFLPDRFLDTYVPCSMTSDCHLRSFCLTTHSRFDTGTYPAICIFQRFLRFSLFCFKLCIRTVPQSVLEKPTKHSFLVRVPLLTLSTPFPSPNSVFLPLLVVPNLSTPRLMVLLVVRVSPLSPSSIWISLWRMATTSTAWSLVVPLTLAD
jgi:hypothetical protein